MIGKLHRLECRDQLNAVRLVGISDNAAFAERQACHALHDIDRTDRCHAGCAHAPAGNIRMAGFSEDHHALVCH